jgi:hypothetical protein
MQKTAVHLCVGLATAVSAWLMSPHKSDDSKTYCRLRFGTESACEIILGLSSDELLLFRSANIESTPERFPLDHGCLPEGTTIPPIKAPDGTKYEITAISEYNDEQPLKRHALVVDVKVDRDPPLYQYCDVELSTDVASLKTAHFDAAMTIVPVMINWELPAGLQFEIGGEPLELPAHVGTMDRSSGCWTVIESGERNFPMGRTNPTVTVIFPGPDPATPIVQDFVLDKFC